MEVLNKKPEEIKLELKAQKKSRNFIVKTKSIITSNRESREVIFVGLHDTIDLIKKDFEDFYDCEVNPDLYSSFKVEDS